jgi:anti-sigma28 factor (negative regulator of flagellin synthesis)
LYLNFSKEIPAQATAIHSPSTVKIRRKTKRSRQLTPPPQNSAVTTDDDDWKPSSSDRHTRRRRHHSPNPALTAPKSCVTTRSVTSGITTEEKVKALAREINKGNIKKVLVVAGAGLSCGN